MENRPTDNRTDVEIIEFRPFSKNTLQGFLTVRTKAGWEFSGIALHEKGGKRWISMPARPYKKEDGSESWIPLIKLADPQKWEMFQKAVLTAMEDYRTTKSEMTKGEEDVPF